MQELLLVNPSGRMSNPRRRRRRNASAKQRAWRKKFGQMYGGGRRRRNPKKRRAARRGGSVMRSVRRKGGGLASRASWHASGYRRNPRRRRYRRNPAFALGRFRLPTMTGITRTVTEAGQGAIGATLVDLVMGQMAVRNWLPAFAYTDMGYPLVKGALAIGTAALAEYVIPRPFRGIATEMAKGSITITLAGVIRQFMPATLPMGARRFGYGGAGYIPSGRPRAMAGMSEYLSATPGSMSMREMESYGPGYVAQNIGGRTGEYLSEYLSK